MNKQLKLIDVTLRDGGHVCHFQFEQQTLITLLTVLNQANIDVIEIGYRNGYLNAPDLLGAAALCDDQYIAFCRKAVTNSAISVMIHPQLVTEDDIKALSDLGVDLVRICIEYRKAPQAIEIIQLCQKYKLSVSANLTHASNYSFESLKEDAALLINAGISMLYLADSNGSFLPEQIRECYQYLVKTSSIAIGFHGHDNIGLAQTNSIMALQAGATMIDASLHGLGKGGGNLVLEKWLAYLYACKYRHYDLAKIVSLAQELPLSKLAKVTNLNEVVRGVCDLSTAELKALKIKPESLLKI